MQITITKEQKAILDILEDSEVVCYQKFPVNPKEWEPYSYSAVLAISPTAIERIKMLWKLPTNQEI